MNQFSSKEARSRKPEARMEIDEVEGADPRSKASDLGLWTLDFGLVASSTFIPQLLSELMSYILSSGFRFFLHFPGEIAAATFPRGEAPSRCPRDG